MNQERRTWPRAEAGAQVWIVPPDPGAPVGYRAFNLSAGGAMLADGPKLHAGRELKLMLPLRGRDLVLHARVLRAETDPSGQPCAALAFRAVPTFVQDLIQNHVLRVLAQRPSPDLRPTVPGDGGGDGEFESFGSPPVHGRTPLR